MNTYMDLETLTLGNIVDYEGQCYMMETIGYEFCLIRKTDLRKDPLIRVDYCDIDGVYLDHTIFSKAGFNRVGDAYSLNGFVVSVVDEERALYSITYGNKIREFCYVHELQNLYRLLTEAKLELNLMDYTPVS